VRYDDDVRFLHTGEQYLVGAMPDAVTGVLRSKVRTPAPLFGGDAVIGLNDTDVTCPKVEDGVRTLLANGRDVDTGVLAPLKTAKKSVAKAFLKPMAIAFGILVLLASIKLLMFAMVPSGARTAGGSAAAGARRSATRSAPCSRGGRRRRRARPAAGVFLTALRLGVGAAAEIGHRVLQAVGIAVERAAGDEHVGAGRDRGLDRVGPDPTVDFDVDVVAAAGRPNHLGDLAIFGSIDEMYC
jgi:hypothetical protein